MTKKDAALVEILEIAKPLWIVCQRGVLIKSEYLLAQLDAILKAASQALNAKE